MGRWLLLLAPMTLCAADLTGIWTGTDDIAFQFRTKGTSLTGKLFGDEFDLPLTDTVLAGDRIEFTVTSMNYYSGRAMKFRYMGTIRGNEIELTRDGGGKNAGPKKIVLKRLTS